MDFNIGDSVLLFTEWYCTWDVCELFRLPIRIYFGEGHYHPETLEGIITKIEPSVNDKRIIYAKYSNGEEIGVFEDNLGLIPLIK